MTKHALWGATALGCLLVGSAHAQITPGTAASWVSVFPIPPPPNGSSNGYVPGYVIEEYDPTVGYPRVTSPTHPLDVNVVSGGGGGGGGTSSTVAQGTPGTAPWPVLDAPATVVSSTGTLAMGTAGTAYTITNAGYGALSVSLAGLAASGGSVQFKASDNGSTFYLVGGLNGAANTRYTTATADGSYSFSVAGRSQTQVVVATTGTGSVTIGYTLSPATRIVTLDTSPGSPSFMTDVVAGAAVSATNGLPITGSTGGPPVGVSATALPLPTGAATSASQPVLNADGGSLAHVSNFPATQAVSATSLPLPTGAATAANQTPPTAAGTSGSVATPVQGIQNGVAQNTATPPLAYSVSTSYTAATTSGTLFAPGAFTRYVQVCTAPASTSNVWLNPTGGAAVVGSGIPVYKGGGCTTMGSQALPLPTSAVTSITDGAASQTLSVAGG